MEQKGEDSLRRCLLLVLIALFTSGCWSRTEVSDLAIVSLIALDRTEDGQMGLWLHIVNPRQVGRIVGGGGAGGNDLPFVTLHARGETLMQASRQIQLELSRKLFWAHARVILIGEGLARSGVKEAVDFLTRHRELRLTNYLLTVPGPVESLIASRFDLEHLPAEALRELSRSGIGARVTVGEFARTLASPGSATFTGTARAVPPPEGAPAGQQSSVQLSGAALYREGRLVGFLDDRETRGLLWLRGEMGRGALNVTIPGKEGFVAMEWVSASVRRVAQPYGKQILIQLQASVDTDVKEQSAALDLSNPQVIQQIETQVRKAVQQRMETALQRLQELNVDAADFGTLIHRQQPQLMRPYAAGWPLDWAERLRIVIEVDARVRRTGLSNKPRGLRDEELSEGGRQR